MLLVPVVSLALLLLLLLLLLLNFYAESA
jgi:hypothetical protein